MTYKEIHNSFKVQTLALNAFFKEFNYGQVLEFNRIENLEYPNVYFELISGTNFSFGVSQETYNCALIFSDISYEDLNNRIEILSRLNEFVKTFFYFYNDNYSDQFYIESYTTLFGEEGKQDRVYYIRAEFSVVCLYNKICTDLQNIPTTC